MLRLAADENFNGDTSEGSLAETRSLISSAFKMWAPLVRMTPQFSSGPPTRGASSSRTISRRWQARIRSNRSRSADARVFEVRSVATVGQAIDDLILVAECSFEGEW